MGNSKKLTKTPPAPISVQQTGANNLNVNNQEGGTVNLNVYYKTVQFREDGRPYVPINHVRFDAQKNIIYCGNDQIKVTAELVQPALDLQENLPFINALCEVYEEKIGAEAGSLTHKNIQSLPMNLQRHFSSQKSAYFQMDYVRHIARETFVDGEIQWDALKKDAYDGIEETYYDEDYESGYERLKAVLEKITSITLDKSALVNIVGLIGNLEKKGLCHVMVNDGEIKSWVNVDG